MSKRLDTLEHILVNMAKTLSRIEDSLKANSEASLSPRKTFIDKAKARAKTPCAKLGKATGETVECDSCSPAKPDGERAKVRLRVYSCSEFGTCTIGKRVDSVPGCCKGCTKYEAR